jgi:hypothetical protein
MQQCVISVLHGSISSGLRASFTGVREKANHVVMCGDVHRYDDLQGEWQHLLTGNQTVFSIATAVAPNLASYFVFRILTAFQGTS